MYICGYRWSISSCVPVHDAVALFSAVTAGVWGECISEFTRFIDQTLPSWRQYGWKQCLKWCCSPWANWLNVFHVFFIVFLPWRNSGLLRESYLIWSHPWCQYESPRPPVHIQEYRGLWRQCNQSCHARLLWGIPPWSYRHLTALEDV